MMYRVILIDDEPLILAGIASLITWEEHDCVIVGKSSNGPNAYEMIQNLNPDIVITDIRMPVINGLELVAKCKQAGCTFAFIVLTNLEEFDLAKWAISLGASDYLVKLNLESGQLITALARAKENCNLLVSRKEHQFMHDMWKDNEEEMTRSLFQNIFALKSSSMEPDELSSAAIKLGLQEKYTHPLILLISVRRDHISFHTTSSEEDSSVLLTPQSADIVTSIAGRTFNRTCCLLEYDSSTYLLITSLENPSSYQQLLPAFCNKLQTAFHNYFELQTVFGISSCKESWNAVTDALPEAETALDYYYYDSLSPIVYYTGQTIHHSSVSSFNINFLKKELSSSIERNDSVLLMTIFRQIINLFNEEKPGKEHAVNACINIYTYLASFFETADDSYRDIFPYTINIAEQLKSFSCLADILAWFESFAENLANFLADRKNTKSDKLVELAKKYIFEHYTEKFGLAEISEALNISSGYLSTSFKKDTGKTISDYIAEVKITYAKDLIKKRKFLIYEISNQLGFENPYYFSKVFKKVTGISPKEYEANETSL